MKNVVVSILEITIKDEGQQGMVSISSLVDLLVDLRDKLREATQYELSDQLRSELLNIGIQLEDKPEGRIWKMKI